MANSIKSNQNKLNRRPDGTLEPPAFNDATAEDYAVAFFRERERIKRERATEIREREYEEDRKANRDLREEIEDAINEKIQDKIDGLIPAWATPFTDTIKWAEENRLRVQSLLLGLPDDEFNPGIKWSDLPPEAKSDYVPVVFNPPRQWWHEFVASTPKQDIPLDTSKGYYALWKYTGFTTVANFRLNIPNHSLNGVASANYTTAMNTNPVGFTWAVRSPRDNWLYNSWQNDFAPGLPASTYTGSFNGIRSGRWDCFGKEPFGGRLEGSGYKFSPEEIAKATQRVSHTGNGFIQYYPIATITGSYQAYPSGSGASGQNIVIEAPCEILFAVKLTGRGGYQIPEMVSPYGTYGLYFHDTVAGNDARQKIYYSSTYWQYKLFYRGAPFDPFEYDAFLCSFAAVFKSTIIDYYVGRNDGRQPHKIYPEPYLYEIESNSKYPKPPISPPPPPPPKKCDCMSNCCPQNKSDLEDLKRLVRVMASKVTELDKKIGEPQSVSLWDVDITQQGSKVETKKPESVLTHLALVNERIEMALRIIGIHEIPIEVEASASVFDGFSEMLMSSSVSAIQSLGKELKSRTTGKTRITSVMQYIDWVSDTLHEKLGHYEQEVDIKDLDLIQEGDQSSKIFFPDMGSMLNATYKYSVDSAVKAQAITSISVRALMEVISIKKMLAEIGFQVDATADYLGYEYTEESVKMKILATLGQSIGNLPAMLKESEIDIKKQTLSSNEQPLESKLVELQQAAAIIKAVHTIPLGRNESKWKDILGKLLDATTKLAGESDGDYEKWIEEINKFIVSEEMPLKLEKVEPPSKK